MPKFAANLTMLYNELGGSKWDHSALARSLEIMANFEIGQRPRQA